MKRCSLFFIWIIILSFSLSEAQINVAVFDLYTDNYKLKDNNRALTDRLMIELHNTRRFNVIERKYIQDVLKEQGFQQTGVTESDDAVKVGKLLGVHAIVLGSISIVDEALGPEQYSVNARLISIQSGIILKTAVYDFSGQFDHLIQYGMKNIAYQLAGLSSPQKNYAEPSSPQQANLPDVPSYLNNDFSVTKTTLGIEWGPIASLRNGQSYMVWVGGTDGRTSIRLRGVYAQKDIPQIFYKDGFGEGKADNAYSLYVDYINGNFRGFWMGVGFGYFQLSVGHEKESERVSYELLSLASSMGAMAKIGSYFYLNFEVDLHFFILGERDFSVGRHMFFGNDLGLDYEIGVGWHF